MNGKYQILKADSFLSFPSLLLTSGQCLLRSYLMPMPMKNTKIRVNECKDCSHGVHSPVWKQIWPKVIATHSKHFSISGWARHSKSWGGSIGPAEGEPIQHGTPDVLWGCVLSFIKPWHTMRNNVCCSSWLAWPWASWILPSTCHKILDMDTTRVTIVTRGQSKSALLGKPSEITHDKPVCGSQRWAWTNLVRCLVSKDHVCLGYGWTT